jgi:type IV/VI secretion system ImpK/VasF family protein
MSPRFAQFVDPIFMHVIALVESIDNGMQPPPERERRLINEQLRNAERELARTHDESWQLAKYALVSWIDELLFNASSWTGRNWWLGHLLEREHYPRGSVDRAEMFFVKAKEALNVPGGDDALETFYICAMLGFYGFYGHGSQHEDTERISLRVQQFDLPPDFTAWCGNMADVIGQRHAQQRSNADVEAAEQTIVTARPMWGRAKLLWPWLLAVLVGGLLVIAMNAK